MYTQVSGHLYVKGRNWYLRSREQVDQMAPGY